MKLARNVAIICVVCACSWSADTSMKAQLKEVLSKHAAIDKNESKKPQTSNVPLIKGVPAEDLPPSPP